jgi:hypothetical protein
MRLAFGMLKYRLNATEVGPSFVLLDDAKSVIDAGGTIGN